MSCAGIHGAIDRPLADLSARTRETIAEAKRKGWAPDDSLQVVALSATLSRPSDVAAIYLRDGEWVEIPEVEGWLQIEDELGKIQQAEWHPVTG